MRDPISIEAAASDLIHKCLLLYAPQGMRPVGAGHDPAKGDVLAQAAATAGAMQYLHLMFERPGWGMTASIAIRWEAKHPKPAENDSVYEPNIEVSWSSSAFSPGIACAVARMHQEVAEFAGLIEATLKQQPLVQWGMESEVPEKFRPKKV